MKKLRRVIGLVLVLSMVMCVMAVPAMATTTSRSCNICAKKTTWETRCLNKQSGKSVTLTCGKVSGCTYVWYEYSGRQWCKQCNNTDTLYHKESELHSQCGSKNFCHYTKV